MFYAVDQASQCALCCGGEGYTDGDKNSRRTKETILTVFFNHRRMYVSLETIGNLPGHQNWCPDILLVLLQ